MVDERTGEPDSLISALEGTIQNETERQKDSNTEERRGEERDIEDTLRRSNRHIN